MRKFLIGFLLLITYFNAAWADEDAATFNVKLATQKLTLLNKNLSVSHAAPAAYLDAIDTIDELINQALLCTEDTQKELNDIDIFMKQSKKLAETTASADLVYLERQKKKWSNIQAECRLFTIRATEQVEDYKHTVIVLREKATLSRSTPIWTLLQTLQTNASPSNTKQNIADVISTHTALNVPYLIIAVLTAFSFSLLFLISLRKTTFSVRYLHFKQLKLRYIVLLTLSLTTAIFLAPFLFNYTVHDESNPLIRPLGRPACWLANDAWSAGCQSWVATTVA